MNLQWYYQLDDLLSEIQEWLTLNVYREGEITYKWSDGQLVTRFNRYFTNLNKPTEVIFSNVLYFKHEEDLLAFRLKFGINI
jgi:hypothetical protein